MDPRTRQFLRRRVEREEREHLDDEDLERRRCHLAHGGWNEVDRTCSPMPRGLNRWADDLSVELPGGLLDEGRPERVKWMREILMTQHPWYRDAEDYDQWSDQRRMTWDTAALATAVAEMLTEESPDQGVIIGEEDLAPISFDRAVRQRIDRLEQQRRSRPQREAKRRCRNNISADYCARTHPAMCRWDGRVCRLTNDLQAIWSVIENSCGGEGNRTDLQDLLLAMYDEDLLFVHPDDLFLFARRVLSSHVAIVQLCRMALLGFAFLQASQRRPPGWLREIRDFMNSAHPPGSALERSFRALSTHYREMENLLQDQEHLPLSERLEILPPLIEEFDRLFRNRFPRQRAPRQLGFSVAR